MVRHLQETPTGDSNSAAPAENRIRAGTWRRGFSRAKQASALAALRACMLHHVSSLPQLLPYKRGCEHRTVRESTFPIRINNMCRDWRASPLPTLPLLRRLRTLLVTGR